MPAVDGIVSGFDTTALIDAIATAYSGPLEIMEGDLEDLQDQLDKTAGLGNRLGDLSDAIEGLQGDDGLVAYTATTSMEGAFTATADTGAAPGTYSVEVVSMATNETSVSGGVADPDAGLGGGTFSVTVGGETTDITLTAGTDDSLYDLASQLDGVDGISAYVLNTRDGSGSPYKLVVSGDDTGADAGVTLDGSAFGMTFTEEVSAEDAQLRVNNVEVNSATNTFSGIPGIEIDLQRAGDGPVQLTVGLDQETMEANVQAFVDAYNEVISYYDTNTAYDSENGIAGALVGDSTARRVVDSIGTLIATAAPVDGTDLEALSQIGIKTMQDGTLELDSAALEEALSEDLEGVRTMLSADEGPLGTLQATIDDTFVDETSGTLSSKEDSLENSIEELEIRIEDQQVRLEDYTSFLREKFTAMEVAMSQFESTGQYLQGLFAKQES